MKKLSAVAAVSPRVAFYAGPRQQPRNIGMEAFLKQQGFGHFSDSKERWAPP